VDFETDAVIQECLRTEMNDATIITVAHRLNTLVDYDRILVLDKGKIVEFDTPKNLMANGEVFKSMVANTGKQCMELFLNL
jgi:ATP-binding cassette, subfamily C (CFTR/MRP), member 1